MKKQVIQNPVIEKDILRYRKNKLASNLALLGLVFGCIYFMVFFAQVKNDNFYYKWSIAFDVIYNLFFLLLTFLFSEEVKNYRRNLFPVQMILGVLQIARIFWLPLTGYTNGAIEISSFLWLTFSLALSGACIIASGIIGFIRSKNLENFVAEIENGQVDLDAALKEVEEEEAKKLAEETAVSAESNNSTEGGTK
jgi:hypothetical protein